MPTFRYRQLAFVAMFLLLPTPMVTAEIVTFGSGSNMFDLEFVEIGNPGNADDTTGFPNPAGKVEYAYRIGKYEISEDMINKANAEGGLGITHDNRGANKPATSTNWYGAAKFVNWLNMSSGHTPAYKFDGGGNFQLWQSGDAGYDANNLFRNTEAEYFLPSADEWYKAAYYDPSGDVYYDYATGSDTAPTAVASGTAANTAVFEQSFSPGPADITQAGGLSPYGTMGQGGNVFEWEETNFDLVNDNSFSRALRGGSWFFFSHEISSLSRSSTSRTDLFRDVGFRVASRSATVPEPNAVFACSVLGIVSLNRRKRRLRK